MYVLSGENNKSSDDSLGVSPPPPPSARRTPHTYPTYYRVSPLPSRYPRRKFRKLKGSDGWINDDQDKNNYNGAGAKKMKENFASPKPNRLLPFFFFAFVVSRL